MSPVGREKVWPEAAIAVLILLGSVPVLTGWLWILVTQVLPSGPCSHRTAQFEVVRYHRVGVDGRLSWGLGLQEEAHDIRNLLATDRVLNLRSVEVCIGERGAVGLRAGCLRCLRFLSSSS